MHTCGVCVCVCMYVCVHTPTIIHQYDVHMEVREQLLPQCGSWDLNSGNRLISKCLYLLSHLAVSLLVFFF